MVPYTAAQTIGKLTIVLLTAMRVSVQSLFLFTMFVIRDFFHATGSTDILSPEISTLVLLCVLLLIDSGAMSLIKGNFVECYPGVSLLGVRRSRKHLAITPFACCSLCHWSLSLFALVAPHFLPLAHLAPKHMIAYFRLWICDSPDIISPSSSDCSDNSLNHFSVQLYPASISNFSPEIVFSSLQNDVYLFLFLIKVSFMWKFVWQIASSPLLHHFIPFSTYVCIKIVSQVWCSPHMQILLGNHENIYM
jgi:hypothetical protein